MQPLQCETTVFEYPEARFCIVFPGIFQDKFSSRHFIIILSIFSHLGTPFGDLWLHFCGSLFQVAKKSKCFFGTCSWAWAICNPAGRRGELEASGRHLRGIWEASGGIWEASGRARCQRRPGGGTEGKRVQTIMCFCQKWRVRPFRVHGSVVTLTKSAACT